MIKTSIIGSGSWALALSKIFVDKNFTIKCRNIHKIKRNFSKESTIITDKFSDLKDSDYIFLAIPSQSVRQILNNLKKYSKKNKSIFIICSKGVEKKTNKLMSEVVNDIFPENQKVIQL